MQISIQSTSALAKQLGLSRWTVSRALNGHAGIRAETAERVRAAARAFGFSPSVLGRGLRTGRTDLVGVCVPDLEDYFLTSKISRLQHAVQQRGLHVMLHITDGTAEGERWALERFAAMHCSAVVLIASDLMPSDPSLSGLRSAGVTVVSIDPRHPGHHLEVSTDRAHAMRNAVIWCRNAGFRNVVTIGITSNPGYGRQRITGIERGCRTCHWKFSESIIALDEGDESNDFSSGKSFAVEYVERFPRKKPPVICLNDRMAVGFCQGLRNAGIRVPEDVSVIGYDNADFSAYAEPPLSTIDPQVDVLIRKAVELLLLGERSEGAKKILVRPRLILRGSTRVSPAK